MTQDTGFFDRPSSPWLVLVSLPRFGSQRWLALREHFDDPLALLTSNAATQKSLGLQTPARDLLLAWQHRDSSHPALARCRAISDQCRRQDIQLVCWDDSAFPEPLRHIHDAPILLYVRGDPGLLARPQIGVVGSRNATRAGLGLARAFAASLSERGYLITSGMALGIDGAAHAGALDAGFATVGVVGTGVDVVYPRQHGPLGVEIAARGALVSELPPGAAPKAHHFPRRNRIISGLSRGVLVVEASLRSGSLITARLALEQGREVFAIPGSVHSPMARGCHELIRQGARLVETVDDIEEELGAWWSGLEPVSATTGEPGGADDPLRSVLAPREIAVLEALGYDPVSTDQLCTATGLPAEQLMQSLLLLEMEGLVDAAPGGYQRIP